MVVARTQCISIIDESSPSTSTHQSDWASFRNNYPDREFWLLQPAGTRWDFGDLNRPSNFLSDSLARTRTVNRDDGNVSNRSDWFEICNFDTQPPGSYVSVWLDISGSMVFATVEASYNYFIQRCTNAGINVILETSNSGERWIPGHNEDFPPSASFSSDPDFLTNFNVDDTVTIEYGESASLSWIVFGDVDSATISGIGPVTDPSGTISVSPTTTTDYTLSVSGPAGNQSRTITVTVNDPPPPTITLSASPTSFIRGVTGPSILSWNVSGVSVDFLKLNGVNVLTSPGLTTTNYAVNPTNDTTYTLVAKNFSGDSEVDSQASASVDITVYEPAVIDSFYAQPNPMVVGSLAGTRLIWETSGDISTATISPPITDDGEVLLESSSFVFPVATTTYTLTVSGDGGTDVASVTVEVCQIPQISGEFPPSLDYGEDFTTTISYRNASSTCGVTITYTNIEGTATSETRNFTLSSSDKDNTETEVTFNSNIPWDNFGPKRISYALFASGCGGNVTPTASTINVSIDMLPDAVTIPDSLEQLPEDQVEAPDIETVLSSPIVIDDIDIPVEIKANEPIQVRFDDADPDLNTSWYNVREISD